MYDISSAWKSGASWAPMMHDFFPQGHFFSSVLELSRSIRWKCGASCWKARMDLLETIRLLMTLPLRYTVLSRVIARSFFLTLRTATPLVEATANL